MCFISEREVGADRKVSISRPGHLIRTDVGQIKKLKHVPSKNDAHNM